MQLFSRMDVYLEQMLSMDMGGGGGTFRRPAGDKTIESACVWTVGGDREQAMHMAENCLFSHRVRITNFLKHFHVKQQNGNGKMAFSPEVETGP